jgi:hypothetical protein
LVEEGTVMVGKELKVEAAAVKMFVRSATVIPAIGWSEGGGAVGAIVCPRVMARARAVGEEA